MIFGTNLLHKATNSIMRFYVNEWQHARGATSLCVSSRVRFMIQATNFQRKYKTVSW